MTTKKTCTTCKGDAGKKEWLHCEKCRPITALAVKEHAGWRGFKTYAVSILPDSREAVTVYPDVSFDDSSFKKYEINWSAFGSVTIEQTKEFIAALQKAVEIAEAGTKKGGK